MARHPGIARMNRGMARRIRPPALTSEPSNGIGRLARYIRAWCLLPRSSGRDAGAEEALMRFRQVGESNHMLPYRFWRGGDLHAAVFFEDGRRNVYIPTETGERKQNHRGDTTFGRRCVFASVGEPCSERTWGQGKWRGHDDTDQPFEAHKQEEHQRPEARRS